MRAPDKTREPTLFERTDALLSEMAFLMLDVSAALRAMRTASKRGAIADAETAQFHTDRFLSRLTALNKSFRVALDNEQGLSP